MTRKNYHPVLNGEQWQPGSYTKNEPEFMNGLTIQDARRECTRLNTRISEPTSMDIDSGLGIGGINNDQSMPVIPSLRAMDRYDAHIADLRKRGFDADGAPLEYD